MKQTFRVKAYSKKIPCGPGYIGYEEIHIQELQQLKYNFFWTTIDQEEVPNYAFYSNAFLGDTGGWTSKFAEHINKK